MAWKSEKPPLRASEWEVRPCSLATAQALVGRYHYSRGGSNTAVAVHGLFPKGSLWENDCAGVCWWIPPTRSCAESINGEDWQRVLSLSRLVVTPETPGNAASFLMARSIRLLDRSKWPVLVTYADSWRGHTGAIYKATGWTLDGTTKPQRVYVRDGRMIARKAGPKTRTHSEMLGLGAICAGSFAKERFLLRA